MYIFPGNLEIKNGKWLDARFNWLFQRIVLKHKFEHANI